MTAAVQPDLQDMANELAAIAPGVAHLQDTFASGKTRNYAWRVSQLKALRKMTEEQQDRIAAALKADLHKGAKESWISEIGFVIGEVDHTLKHLRRWMRARKVSTPLSAQPGKSYRLPEPLGTVLIIGAWNYPFNLVLSPMVAAIAAGNCVVLKPSELSSETSRVIAELVPQYLDNDAFMVVEGAVAETTELLKQRFDHILYTGGEGVGKIVMRAAAEHLTPVTLELGGKSPAIVHPDANLKVTAARIAWSKWMNAAQTCVAPDYILVEASQADTLVAAIQAKIKEFYGEDPKLSEDYGRIVNERHFARLSSYLTGQNIVHGGQTEPATKYMAPTIVLNPDLDSPLMQEEIFGPILPIITLDNIDKAIAFVNARSKPLALYVYTNNSRFEKRVLNETSAGNVCVNDGFMFMLNPELPFGGVGNSGMGAYHGKSGFDTFSHLKTVMKRKFMFDLDVRYPPYTNFKFNLLKKLL